MYYPRPITIGEALSRKIAFMSNVAACCVVALHTWVSPGEGSVSWWVNNLCFNGGLTQVAVPLFFGLSGFLMAGRMTGVGWYGGLMRSKCLTLLIPYIFFCLLWWVYVDCVVYVADSVGLNLCVIKPIPVTFSGIISVFGLDVNRNPSLYVLWFVRILFLLFLVSPCFCVLKRRGGGMILIVLFAVYFWWNWTRGERGAYGMFLSRTFSVAGLLYFCSGIYLRFHGHVFSCWLDRAIKVIAVMVPVLLFCSVVYQRIEPFATMICICFLIGVVRNVDVRIFVDRRLSFPLYVLHPFLLVAVNGLMYLICGRSVANGSLLVAFVRCVVVVVGSICAARLFRWALPRFSAFVFGGR